MPRERITSPSSTYTLDGNDFDVLDSDSIPEGAVSIQVPQLHVSWTKADHEYGSSAHVQVALEVDARHVMERFASNTHETTRNWFYTDTLDRTTINLLIRTLRRARDTAFGRDE